MNDIEVYSSIKPESLSPHRYFASLLEQAAVQGLLTGAELERIQMDTLTLLSKKAQLYTGMDSSSVTVETAEELLGSIVFTLSLRLKAFPSPDAAIDALLSDGVAVLYAQGRTRIDRLLSKAHALHSAILQNLFQTPNEFYSATFIGGIGGFFKLYRPDYAAQEIHITADYPVHHPVSSCEGVEFILRYLQCIYCENAFCALFDHHKVHRLLLAHNKSYTKLPINLYEPVLICALGCEMSGESPRGLCLPPAALNELEVKLSGKTKAAIKSLLSAALNDLAADLQLPAQLSDYLADSLPSIAAYIENSVKRSSLKSIFPCA